MNQIQYKRKVLDSFSSDCKVSLDNLEIRAEAIYPIFSPTTDAYELAKRYPTMANTERVGAAIIDSYDPETSELVYSTSYQIPTDGVLIPVYGTKVDIDDDGAVYTYDVTMLYGFLPIPECELCKIGAKGELCR